MDKQDKKPAESAPVETDKTKISIKAGQKNQIVINPPEKPPAKNVNELFSSARQKHSVVLEKKTELVLQAKARQADLPEETILQVFVRGYKNLPINSQLTREQYAMNRVNSFIAGGAAMDEDYDLLPIQERITHIGRKGTGGGSRPHIKREKSPYNNKTVYHVIDARGVVKHSTSDEGEAKKHLANKYNSYLGEEGKGLWANIHAKRERIKRGSGEHMRKPGSEGAPTAADLKRSAVSEGTSAAVRMQRALEKIKADRERKERLAKPYVDQLLGKKEEKQTQKEQMGEASSLLDRIRSQSQQKANANKASFDAMSPEQKQKAKANAIVSRKKAV
jgi:hypothetical protein